MNIFVLDRDPKLAARYMCDKHVPKMVLETAQMLCSAFPQGVAPYKRAHYNHPCTVWARHAVTNYEWLITHGLALSHEYQIRFNKIHKSSEVIDWCRLAAPDYNYFQNPMLTMKYEMTPFAQAMPDIYKSHDPVEAYRAYYIGAKSRFAKWQRGVSPPQWWPNANPA